MQHEPWRSWMFAVVMIVVGIALAFLIVALTLLSPEC